MTRAKVEWEYRIVKHFGEYGLADALNKYGKDGWELIHTELKNVRASTCDCGCDFSYDEKEYDLYFKRPKGD